MDSIPAVAAVLVFPAALAYAAASDILTMTIPNRLSLLLVAAFPLAAALAGLGWETAGLHVLVGLGVLAATFGLFALGWIGGGDAKLAAVAALWLGPQATILFLVYAAVLGGGLALLFLTFRGLPLPAFAYREAWILRLHTPGNGIPYGVALAGGALIAFSGTPWFTVLVAGLAA